MPTDRNAENKEKDTKKSVALYLHDIVYTLTGLLLVFLLIFRVVVVSGNSMYSTLKDGDYLLLLGNIFYSEPRYGDVVVVTKDSFENGKPIVKRIIAVPGQVVDIDFTSGVVYVDGQAIEEPYTNTATNLSEGTCFPLTVEENCYFVLGDNRNASRDSRSPEIGLVDRREILGKAIFLVFPGFDTIIGKVELNRIGALH